MRDVGVARGGLWQAIRDWLRPIDREDAIASTHDVHRVKSRLDVSGRPDRASVGPAYGRRTGSSAYGPGDAGAAAFEPAFDRPSGAGSDAPSAAPAEAAGLEPVSEAELLDFLAADLDPVAADPVFRERLREELWEMIVDDGIVSAKES